MQTLDHYINQVGNLPPAPRILAELLPLLREDNVPAERIVELVTFDPALTARVLRSCNSAAAGLGQPVHELGEAVVQVGFNEIFRLVAAVVGESTLGRPQPGYGIAAGELWQHSAVAALAARQVARRLGEEENLAFTAALLHDLGKLVLGTFLENAVAAVTRQIEQDEHSFVEAEKALIGVEHAEVGGRLLARWNFPPELVRAVWHHHEPLLAQPHERLAALVHLGDMLAHFLGYGYGHQAYAVRSRPEVLEILELTPGEIETFVLETEAAMKTTKWFVPAGA